MMEITRELAKFNHIKNLDKDIMIYLAKTLDKNIKIELPDGKIYDIIYMYPLGEEGNKDIILKVDEGIEDEY